jgi:hypothetical protein
MYGDSTGDTMRLEINRRGKGKNKRGKGRGI